MKNVIIQSGDTWISGIPPDLGERLYERKITWKTLFLCVEHKNLGLFSDNTLRTEKIEFPQIWGIPPD